MSNIPLHHAQMIETMSPLERAVDRLRGLLNDDCSVRAFSSIRWRLLNMDWLTVEHSAILDNEVLVTELKGDFKSNGPILRSLFRNNQLNDLIYSLVESDSNCIIRSNCGCGMDRVVAQFYLVRLGRLGQTGDPIDGQSSSRYIVRCRTGCIEVYHLDFDTGISCRIDWDLMYDIFHGVHPDVVVDADCRVIQDNYK